MAVEALRLGVQVSTNTQRALVKLQKISTLQLMERPAMQGMLPAVVVQQ
jgi:hypothetical protein